MKLKKIEIENIKIKDLETGHSEVIDKEIINIKESDITLIPRYSPVISLLEKIYLLKYNNYYFDIELSNGYGYITVEFELFEDNTSYRYTQQFMDSKPYLETLHENNILVCLNDNLYCSEPYINSVTKHFRIFINKLYQKDPYFILNSTNIGSLFFDCFRSLTVYKNTYRRSATDEFYIQRSVSGYIGDCKIDDFNNYLERINLDKKIHQLLLPGNFAISTKSGNYYDILQEGDEFFRILSTLLAFNKAKRKKFPLIINNFGVGIDRDKVELLYDLVKESNEIPYSIITTLE